MVDELKDAVIQRVKLVKQMLDCHPDRPGGVDPVKRIVVLPDETITLATYGQRLQASLTNDNEADARKLLAAIL